MFRIDAKYFHGYIFRHFLQFLLHVHNLSFIFEVNQNYVRLLISQSSGINCIINVTSSSCARFMLSAVWMTVSS